MTTKTTERPEPTGEIIDDLRDILAEALRGMAASSAAASIYLEELGDDANAQDEMGVALLTAWLSDNVRAWTHTTRLREGLIKFDPLAGGVALAMLLNEDQEDETEEAAGHAPQIVILDECDGDSTTCHACRTEHPGGVGGAFCPAAGYVFPVSPDELDEDEEGPQ